MGRAALAVLAPVVREVDIVLHAVERRVGADGHLRVVLGHHECRVARPLAAAAHHDAPAAARRRLARRRVHAALRAQHRRAEHGLGDAVGLHLDVGGLHPLLVGRAPHAPARGDLLGMVRERARLQPALPEASLLALAHVPVRREEPAHARGVPLLHVAGAVIDELALAEQVGAQLVLVAVVRRVALEQQPWHDKLGAAHVVGPMPLLAIAHLPAALDLLGDPSAVAAAPPPRHLARLGRGADVPIARGLPQAHVAVLAAVERGAVDLLTLEALEVAELVGVHVARGGRRPRDVDLRVAHREDLDALRSHPLALALVPHLPGARDVLG
mmetsp:Transcript_2756/g.6863  ORF Transcript_2756/g.6863 Transcript_2756/m.6863 type:complete len:328 (-) Transcript_2756:638-1621(-)